MFILQHPLIVVKKEEPEESSHTIKRRCSLETAICRREFSAGKFWAYAKVSKALREELASAIPKFRRMSSLKKYWTKIKDASTNQSEGKATVADDVLKQELKGLDTFSRRPSEDTKNYNQK